MVNITSKIVMCGDYAVGKTTFVKLFLGGGVENEYKATIGVDIGRKVFNLNEHKLTFQIWDLSGQQSFKLIRRQFYNRTDGAILIYDVSRRETYENMINWKKEMLQQTGKIPTVLIANKIDLRDTTGDFVNSQEGEELSKLISDETGMKTPYFESSAINRINNLEPFITLGRSILSLFDS